jgi:hypothetical protein
LSKISKGLTKNAKVLQNSAYVVRSFSATNKDEDSLRKSDTADFGIKARDQHLQFSKAPIMSNFGELPFGDIPEPLKYVRPF